MSVASRSTSRADLPGRVKRFEFIWWVGKFSPAMSIRTLRRTRVAVCCKALTEVRIWEVTRVRVGRRRESAMTGGIVVLQMPVDITAIVATEFGDEIRRMKKSEVLRMELESASCSWNHMRKRTRSSAKV